MTTAPPAGQNTKAVRERGASEGRGFVRGRGHRKPHPVGTHGTIVIQLAVVWQADRAKAGDFSATGSFSFLIHSSNIY